VSQCQRVDGEQLVESHVLQCVTDWCSALQYVAVGCSVLQREGTDESIWWVHMCCNVLQCVAVFCRVLQHVTVRCSMSLCVGV